MESRLAAMRGCLLLEVGFPSHLDGVCNPHTCLMLSGGGIGVDIDLFGSGCFLLQSFVHSTENKMV